MGTRRDKCPNGVFPEMVRTIRDGGSAISPVEEQLSAEVIII